jgi:hypothetical protein
MKVRELIEQLSKMDPEATVMVYSEAQGYLTDRVEVSEVRHKHVYVPYPEPVRVELGGGVWTIDTGTYKEVSVNEVFIGEV